MNTTILIILILLGIIIIAVISCLIKRSKENPQEQIEDKFIQPVNDILPVVERNETVEEEQSNKTSSENGVETQSKVTILRYIKTSGQDDYYKEKLSDQNWKKKSAEIKRKQGYKCQNCGFTTGKPIELNAIEDLKLYVDFNEVYNAVYQAFSSKDVFIQEIKTNNILKTIKIEKNINQSSKVINENLHINSCILIGIYNTIQYQFFTLDMFAEKEFHTHRESVDCKLPFYAKDKVIKNADRIIKEYTHEGNTNNRIILRHDYDYISKIDYRGQGILTYNGFSIVFPLYNIDNNVALNVHHKAYYEDLEPWECPDEELITLCFKCHNRAHEKDIPIKRIIK